MRNLGSIAGEWREGVDPGRDELQALSQRRNLFTSPCPPHTAGPAVRASSPSGRPSAQRQSPSRRQPQPCASLRSSQKATAATAGVSLASGIGVHSIKPSCSAGALLLSLARLVTYSQMSLDLEVGTLHLPPAYDPVPVLDYPHESHFFHLLHPASPAEWQLKDKGRTNTHHYLTLTPDEQQALEKPGYRPCG